MNSRPKIQLAIACGICLTVGVLAVSLPGYYIHQNRDDTLTQVSTIDAILNGLYDGIITYGELQVYGDFGIGTFEGLDGEMVALNGDSYQIKADGVAYPVTEDRTAGGHVLEFVVKDAELTVDYSSELHIILPDTEEFNSLDLTLSKKKELEEAEK